MHLPIQRVLARNFKRHPLCALAARPGDAAVPVDGVTLRIDDRHDDASLLDDDPVLVAVAAPEEAAPAVSV